MGELKIWPIDRSTDSLEELLILLGTPPLR